jgi:DNA-binding transcriptional MocR family regulator
VTIYFPRISSKKPLYLAVVEAIVKDIEDGRLKVGDRLPTQREMADLLELSVGTITRAYSVVERRGLIRGEIGRGTFVAGGERDEYGATEFELDTPGMIDLAVVRPLYHLDPDLSQTMRAMTRRSDLSKLLHYQPNGGMRRHREMGASWVARYDIESHADRIIVCAGAQHALLVTLSSLCRPGDSIFVEELTYPGIKAVARLLDLKLVPLAMDTDGLIPGAFASACVQHNANVLVTIPTIHNPTTATIPDTRRREIAGIAAKNNVAIVEDAVNHLLADDPPLPFAALYPDSFFIAAVSKVVTGGIRVAYLAAPVGSIESLTRAVWASNWMTAPLCAEIASLWIEDGTADETMRRKREEAAKRVKTAREILAGYELSCDDCCHHAWLLLPHAWSGAAQFADEARRYGVAVAPSDLFNVAGNPPAAVRLSLSATRNTEALAEGLKKLKSILRGPSGLGAAIV